MFVIVKVTFSPWQESNLEVARTGWLAFMLREVVSNRSIPICFDNVPVLRLPHA